MRQFIDIINGKLTERFNIDRQELNAPDHTGIVDVHMLADTLKVRDFNHFRAGMMKIFANRSEDLNDFEIFEMAHAFVNFIGLTAEAKMRLAMRLAPINPTSASEDEAEFESEEDLKQELDTLDAEIGDEVKK